MDLASERIIIQSPTSYVGSTRRLWRLTRHDNEWVRWLGLIPLTVTLLVVAWVFVTAWYLVFLLPYRLLRRGARKRRREELQHREVLDAAQQNRA